MSRIETKQSIDCFASWVTAPESRVFYQVRAAGASVQPLVNAILQVLIRGADILKK